MQPYAPVAMPGQLMPHTTDMVTQCTPTPPGVVPAALVTSSSTLQQERTIQTSVGHPLTATPPVPEPPPNQPKAPLLQLSPVVAVGTNPKAPVCEPRSQQLQPGDVEALLGPETFLELRSLLLEQQHEYRCQLHMYQWLLLQHSIHRHQCSSAGSGGSKDAHQPSELNSCPMESETVSNALAKESDDNAKGSTGAGNSGQGSNEASKVAEGIMTADDHTRIVDDLAPQGVHTSRHDDASTKSNESDPQTGLKGSNRESANPCNAGSPESSAPPIASGQAPPLTNVPRSPKAKHGSSLQLAQPATKRMRTTQHQQPHRLATTTIPRKERGSHTSQLHKHKQDHSAHRHLHAETSSKRTTVARVVAEAAEAYDPNTSRIPEQAVEDVHGKKRVRPADKSIVATNLKTLNVDGAPDAKVNNTNNVNNNVIPAKAGKIGSNWPANATPPPNQDHQDFSDSAGASGSGDDATADDKSGSREPADTSGNNSATEQNSGCGDGGEAPAGDAGNYNDSRRSEPNVQASQDQRSGVGNWQNDSQRVTACITGMKSACGTDTQNKVAAGCAAAHPFAPLPGHMRPGHATPMDAWMQCSMPSLGRTSAYTMGMPMGLPRMPQQQMLPSTPITNDGSDRHMGGNTSAMNAALSAMAGAMQCNLQGPVDCDGVTGEQTAGGSFMPRSTQHQQHQHNYMEWNPYLPYNHMGAIPMGLTGAGMMLPPLPGASLSLEPLAQQQQRLDMQQKQIARAQEQLNIQQRSLQQQQIELGLRERQTSANVGDVVYSQQQQSAPPLSWGAVGIPGADITADAQCAMYTPSMYPAPPPWAGVGGANAPAAHQTDRHCFGSAFMKCDGLMKDGAPNGRRKDAPLIFQGLAYPQMLGGQACTATLALQNQQHADGSGVALDVPAFDGAHAEEAGGSNPATSPDGTTTNEQASNAPNKASDNHATAGKSPTEGTRFNTSASSTLRCPPPNSGLPPHSSTMDTNSRDRLKGSDRNDASGSGSANLPPHKRARLESNSNNPVAVGSAEDTTNPGSSLIPPFAGLQPSNNTHAHSMRPPCAQPSCSHPEVANPLLPAFGVDLSLGYHSILDTPQPPTATRNFSHLSSFGVHPVLPPAIPTTPCVDPAPVAAEVDDAGPKTDAPPSPPNDSPAVDPGECKPQPDTSQILPAALAGVSVSAGCVIPEVNAGGLFGGLDLGALAGGLGCDPNSLPASTPAGSASTNPGPWGLDSDLLDWLQSLLPHPHVLVNSTATAEVLKPTWASEQVIALLANPNMLRMGCSFKEATATNIQQIMAIRELHRRSQQQTAGAPSATPVCPRLEINQLTLPACQPNLHASHHSKKAARGDADSAAEKSAQQWGRDMLNRPGPLPSAAWINPDAAVNDSHDSRALTESDGRDMADDHDVSEAVDVA